MRIVTKEIIVSTVGNCDIKNITDNVKEILYGSKMSEGNCNITSIGSTASITTLEYEPGLVKDLPRILDKLIPVYAKYHHNETWGDNNGHAHIRSAIFGTSLNIPFLKGELILGTYQQLILIDFDNRSRNRRVVIQMIGA
ncbi:MAG TPA: secondary thiamine-phosphate synthase enzyme YjbQ [Ignavibacteria bacterium]|nr:secondary thiamine-phosphate synthase enzyme YjbQ [Ignavibacteria bacterium]